MDIYCFPISTLVVFITCVVILGGVLAFSLAGGVLHDRSKRKVLDQGWVLVSLLVVAILAMTAFLFYALTGMKTC